MGKRLILSTLMAFMMFTILQVSLMDMVTRTAHAARLSDPTPIQGDIFADSGQALGNSQSNGVDFGDVDGDGDTDAFVANDGPDKLWLNDGAGIFTDSGQSFPTSDSTDVALGDLNGDGDLDVFVIKTDSSEIWFNDGSGSFSLGQSLGTLSPKTVALGDLDGDGDLDAFVGHVNLASESTWLDIWLNDGTGLFTDSGQSLDNWWPTFVALGDVDADGDLDAFVTNYGANKVWLNNGAGVYSDSGQLLGSSSSLSVSLGDVDGDGDLDAMVGNLSNGTRVWLNDGAGAYTDSAQSLGTAPTVFVDLGDMDRDGDLDLLIATGCCTRASAEWANEVWLNDSTLAILNKLAK